MSGRFDLTGKVSIVTGGARGLGLAFAKGLVQHGSQVALIDIDGDAVKSVATELAEQETGTVVGVACDMSEPDQVQDCIRSIADQFGRIDVLVNNAGIHHRGTPTEFHQNDLQSILAVNLVGCYEACGAAARIMLPAGAGSIINVSALGGGLRGLGRGGSMYAMSKGGIVALTRDLAAEWGSHGIRVNAIAPGWIRTPMTQALQEDTRRSAEVLQRIPLSRWGEPDDVAGLVVFLASDAAAYITGCTIPVDGGAANTIMISSE